jgi:hypothetical protein
MPRFLPAIRSETRRGLCTPLNLCTSHDFDNGNQDFFLEVLRFKIWKRTRRSRNVVPFLIREQPNASM